MEQDHIEQAATQVSTPQVASATAVQLAQSALRQLAHHEFDPTLRQIMAQVMHQEQAGGGAARALQAALEALSEKDALITRLLADNRRLLDKNDGLRRQSFVVAPEAGPESVVRDISDAKRAEPVARKRTRRLNGARP